MSYITKHSPIITAEEGRVIMLNNPDPRNSIGTTAKPEIPMKNGEIISLAV